jgi:hypothetical protein
VLTLVAVEAVKVAVQDLVAVEVLVTQATMQMV